MAKDMLDVIMAQIRAAAPELSADQAAAIALRIRQDFGGARTYIKKAPAAGKVYRLGVALAGGVPLSQAVHDVGIGMRYGFTLLRRRY